MFLGLCVAERLLKLKSATQRRDIMASHGEASILEPDGIHVFEAANLFCGCLLERFPENLHGTYL